LPEEPTADLDDVAAHVRRELDAFARATGDALHLEIEPGTYLVAQAGAVVATCIDVVDTGKDGYLFAKLDTGMTEVTRPSLYAAPSIRFDVMATGFAGGGGRLRRAVLRVGATFSRRRRATRKGWAALGVPAARGRLVIVGGAGAPTAPRCQPSTTTHTRRLPKSCWTPDGTLRLVRRRQSRDQMLENELGP